MPTRRSCLAVVLALGALVPAHAQNPPVATQPYVVEYYYKARWGHQAEFLALFRKNHLPILLKDKEKGRIVALTMTTPRYHATEDGRWDFRVTITFKDLASAHGEGAVTEAETRTLYPDKEAFEREEQRRFEILEAHWDVPVTSEPLTR
jgi:hypothetical protein